jgi:hypothetical protein
VLYGDTWEWNGIEWTQVQDIGPPGRWAHSMTFEFAKQRAVLFGGLSLFAPLTAPINDGLLGDTWSHVDDDAVYVSSAGGDSNPGTVLSPKRTINAAVVSAAGTESESGGRNVRRRKWCRPGERCLDIRRLRSFDVGSIQFARD